MFHRLQRRMNLLLEERRLSLQPLALTHPHQTQLQGRVMEGQEELRYAGLYQVLIPKLEVLIVVYARAQH